MHKAAHLKYTETAIHRAGYSNRILWSYLGDSFVCCSHRTEWLLDNYSLCSWAQCMRSPWCKRTRLPRWEKQMAPVVSLHARYFAWKQKRAVWEFFIKAQSTLMKHSLGSFSFSLPSDQACFQVPHHGQQSGTMRNGTCMRACDDMLPWYVLFKGTRRRTHKTLLSSRGDHNTGPAKNTPQQDGLKLDLAVLPPRVKTIPSVGRYITDMQRKSTVGRSYFMVHFHSIRP